MKILQLNTSARLEESASSFLAARIVDRLKRGKPSAEVTVRDLAHTPIAPLDDLAVQARFTRPEARTPGQAARAAQDDAIVEEMVSSDVIVIGAPMYNFNVSAQFKNWIDAVTRPGVTFSYTPDGPIGLVRNKIVYVALTRGGFYRDTPSDILVAYLKCMFSFLGISNIHLIYAEGMSRGPEAVAKALEGAVEQISGIIGSNQ